MKKNIALILVVIAGFISAIGMAILSIPRKEDLGLFLILVAVLMGLAALIIPKKEKTKKEIS
ncbi:MAG: hypothetical protein GF365_01555 [Candidatus Buchananbacteria bacterium]|nr:hypothetical protein [Candidatus Buchananbacteria bacterium]